MKTKYNIKVEDFCGQPQIKFSYRGNVSWRVGCEGVISGSIRKEPSGGFSAIFSETVLEGRAVCKEVFIDIPEGVVVELFKLAQLANGPVRQICQNTFADCLTENNGGAK